MGDGWMAWLTYVVLLLCQGKLKIKEDLFRERLFEIIQHILEEVEATPFWHANIGKDNIRTFPAWFKKYFPVYLLI